MILTENCLIEDPSGPFFIHSSTKYLSLSSRFTLSDRLQGISFFGIFYFSSQLNKTKHFKCCMDTYIVFTI